jgi:osmotically-inducible protein OsmY
MKTDLANLNDRSDEEIAATANNVIQWLTTVPPESVRVSVHDGWLLLEGELDWWHQKSTLEEVLQRLPGLKGINNLITLRVKSKPATP